MDSCTFVYEGSTACPRPAVEGVPRCLFHLSPAHRRTGNLNENDLREAFQLDIRSSEDRRREYNGVVIEDFDFNLSLLVVDADDLSRLRFRNYTVEGGLSLVGSIVRYPIDLIACSIVNLDLTDSTFEHDVMDQDSHFGAEIDSIACLTEYRRFTDGPGSTDTRDEAEGFRRACDSNNCPVGIATQKSDLRSRLIVDQAATNLERFLMSTVELMEVMARDCGHDSLGGFERRDLTTWKREIADLTGVDYAGVCGT